MKKRQILTFFLLIGMSLPALAIGGGVSGDTTLSLSLNDAQNYAIEHNRTLKNASLEVRIAEAKRWQSIASMLPQVNAKLDYSNLMGYEMELGGMKLAMPANGTIGLTSSIALSGAQIVSSQLGTISMKMADVNVKKTEQEISEQVKLIYISILAAEESIQLLEKNLVSITKLYEYSQKSVDVGVSEQIDADQISVQVATMKTSISSAKRSLEMLYNSLRLQANIDFDVNLVLTQKIDEVLDVENSLSLVLSQFDVRKNFSYQLVEKSTELSKKQVALAGWSYGPTLSIYHQYTAKKYFSDEMTMNMTPPNMLGISLSIPIFSSGKNYNTLRGAQIAYKKQLNTLSDTEMTLKIQHRQLVYNVKSAHERYQTQKQSVDVSQRVFDNIGLKYEYGHASSLDLTTSGTNLLNAQNSYVQSLLEFVQAQIELEKMLNIK